MKKWSLAHFCAYLSLAISITLLVLWCCNVGGFTVVSLDSFVGVIVALLAIIVAFVVGWQIYNSIEIKGKIEELSALKEIINVQEKNINQVTGKSQHLISYILGNEAYKEKRYLDAFRFFMSSLRYSMQLDSPLNVELLLKGLEQINKNISKENDFKPSKTEEISTYNNDIKISSGYNLIKDRYEEIYINFNAKVKVGNG
ncbi:hypothetical protein [Prevotella sp. lc2012]|uniref:hypothetical protein n=1 Tax=Prevotella sp. lc2012 TaxID=1761886 RepID=UPI0008944648|nr:hypothetical protein [Prevotella sp. lc2012]SEE42798.1 hypothetical protein SAMN04487828_1594 [Prevotella sp. lc2012]